jgi:hypothetical protein
MAGLSLLALRAQTYRSIHYRKKMTSLTQSTGGYCARCLNTSNTCKCIQRQAESLRKALTINDLKMVTFTLGLKTYTIPQSEYNLMVQKLERIAKIYSISR